MMRMEHTTILWGNVFGVWHDGRYNNHWGLKGFANVGIAKYLIYLVFILFRPYLFTVLVKLARPYKASPRGAVQWRSAKGWPYLQAHDTAFTLCSVRPHEIFKFKCTPWVLRSTAYVLLMPPQLSWQPNPCMLWRCFLRIASLLLRRVVLLCDAFTFADERASLVGHVYPFAETK